MPRGVYKRTKKSMPEEPIVPEAPEATPEVVVASPEVATPEEPVLPTEESEAKKSFRDFMARYKQQSPAKYALKEKELLAQLDRIP